MSKLIDLVETLVDGTGLYDVLSALSEMCHEKAAHVQEAWQDEDLSEAWTEAAVILDKAADDIPEFD